MKDRIDDIISDWFDSDVDVYSMSDFEELTHHSGPSVADSLLIHGLLADMGCRDELQEAERIRAVMQTIESENEDSITVQQKHSPHLRRHSITILTTLLTIAAAAMLMFVMFGPGQNISAAMASLEKIVKATSEPVDRTYSVRVVEDYPRDQRPRNLSKDVSERKPKAQIDGALLYVRGLNQYVLMVKLDSGLKRTSGCDGQHSWAFREDGPVHVSTDLSRFRGGLPGHQQDIPFINIHVHLSQLRSGYEIELNGQQESASDGTLLSKLVGVRKSRDVRGPKQVEISFDPENGTVHKMLLDGLPRGKGGPKSVLLDLIDQSELSPLFFSHQSHHESGRRIRYEEKQK